MPPEERPSLDAVLQELKSASEYMGRDIKEIKDDIKSLNGKFITREEFMPVKAIAYGLMGVLSIATVGAVLKLVLK